VTFLQIRGQVQPYPQTSTGTNTATPPCPATTTRKNRCSIDPAHIVPNRLVNIPANSQRAATSLATRQQTPG
jgi:hypothetical protein